MINILANRLGKIGQIISRVPVLTRIALPLMFGIVVESGVAEERGLRIVQNSDSKPIQLVMPKEILNRILIATERGAQSAEKMSGIKFPPDLLAESRRSSLTDWAVKEVLAADTPGLIYSLPLPVEFNFYPGPNRIRI